MIRLLFICKKYGYVVSLFILVGALFAIAYSFSLFITLIISGLIIFVCVVASDYNLSRSKSNSYEKYAYLSEWYINVIKRIKTEWCENFVDKIIKHIDGDVRMMSPSANLAYYEKHIYNGFVSKNKNILLQCSDLAVLKNHELDSKEVNGSEFLYLEGSNDAKLVNFNFSQKPNLIFDMKGALWYATKEEAKLEELLTHYHSLLEDGGYLVFDSQHVNYSIAVIKWILSKFLINLYGQERSTLQKINDVYSEILLDRFEFVEQIHIKANKYNLAFNIYRKKVDYDTHVN